MQALESGSGVFYINGLPYELGSLEMRPFGDSDTDVIIVYMPAGNVFSGRRPYTSFTIDGSVPADQTELLAWAAQYFSLCGGGSFNARPVASGVSISGTAQVGQTLTGNYTRTDAESDPAGTPIFKWYKNNVLISGATAQTYVPVTGDIGATIKFGVIVTSTTGTSPGVEVKSAATSAVIAAGGGGLTGFYLQKTNNTPPSEAEILAGTSFSISSAGANYTITFPNPGPRYIFVAEPSTATAKTVMNDTLGDAAINGENAFGAISTVGAFRLYTSNYQTAFDNPVTFKVS